MDKVLNFRLRGQNKHLSDFLLHS